MFDRLADLDSSKTSWRVRVRVSRLWFNIGPNGNFLNVCNLLLLDEGNYQMHALIKPEAWNNLNNEIAEGNIYELSNFRIMVAVGNFRPVRSPMCILFSNNTNIIPINENGLSIPRHKFDFKKLEEPFHFSHSNAEEQSQFYATDFIGTVLEVEPARVVQTSFGQQDFVRFIISDGSFSCKVNVWGEHIGDVAALFDNTLERPVIVILASMRVLKFRAVIELSTIPSSRIYVNLDNQAVRDFRQRLAVQGLEVPPPA